MPTYLCWTQTGQLSAGQRTAIARSITDAHHEVGRAPRYFVQVIFADIAPGSHFIGGRDAPSGHIWIRADIRGGRTQEQKEQLLNRIADETAQIAGVSKDKVWIYISDIPGPSVLEFGHVLPPPGGEEDWFSKLPAELRDRLKSLA
ncbi:MAG: tautomerase family protein [Hyphomicrobium sp.]|uniref:tautomerase family protein n=1 Tax=Hyphomicrobium sp. TaxID=82 RepID=UPI0039E3816B